MIKTIDGKIHYYDKNGKEIFNGCYIRYTNGRTAKVYLTEEGTLGTDATNPAWIESGRAEPTEFGLYPLYNEDTEDCEVVEGLEKYISFEVYEAPQNPTEEGKYISKTPIYEQAERAVKRAAKAGKSYFIKGVTSDGKKVLFL